MGEQHDVKESLELLKGLELLGIDYNKVMADGKLDLTDLRVAGDLMGQFPQLQAAVKDVNKVPKELGDLDEAEIMQLAAAALAVVRAFTHKQQP